MILFVGLGNPTSKYQNTRHNFGFMALEEFLKGHETSFIDKPKFKGFLHKTDKFLALFPQTYMNLSGESVGSVVNFYKIQRVIVLHDDLDIPLGSIRFKKGGSSGGHNGLKSIDTYIGADYERVRLGIGKPQDKSQVINYVLEDFSLEEKDKVQKMCRYTKDALESLLDHSISEVNEKFIIKNPS